MNLFIAGTDFVCVLFLTIIMFAMFFSNNKNGKKNGYFILSVITLLVFCLADGVSYIMDEFGSNDTVHFLCNLFSYAGVDIVLPAFVYYVSEKIRETGSFSKIHARVVLVASAIDMWFIVFGACTGELFSIENQQIVYGTLNNYVGIVQFAVSIYFLAQIFINRKILDKKLVYTVCFYFLLPLFSLVVEFINPSIAFAYMSTALSFLLVYVVIVREDLQASVLSEKIMYKASVTDNLTGLLNRRAYSEDAELIGNEYPLDFIYISLDVNGLKLVNDTIGHAAGDEIISGAARCMKRCFGAYGKVYRTGGDEFTAVLYVPTKQLKEIVDDFEEEVAKWHGKLVDNLSISFGYVNSEEAQGRSIHEVSVLADERMYAAKAAYYSQKGVDRRGQIEAHIALCNLYTKILKINITQDTYKIISMNKDEDVENKGFANNISDWLTGFGESGNVHPDDLEKYLSMVDLEYMRKYFAQEKNSLSVYYRRKYGDVYKHAMMEIIPAGDYSHINQSLFLYVKEIDK